MMFPERELEIIRLAEDVSTGLLASWFQLAVTVRRQAAVLDVRSAVPLPIQMRAARARRVQQALGHGGSDPSGYRRILTPYRPWSAPFVDQELLYTRAHWGHFGDFDIDLRPVRLVVGQPRVFG